MQQYNYVIFQRDSDYYRVSYSDLSNRDDVIYIDHFRPSHPSIVNILYRIHHLKILNVDLRLPAKHIWYPSYFKHSFANNLPLCFIFNSRWMKYPHLREYLLYLKHRYNAKLVCFYQDLVDAHRHVKFHKIFHLFDLILTYDKGDAEKYGLTYHPTVYSNYKVDNDENIPGSDVYFVGSAKDRLALVFDVFYRLKKEGIACDFYLSGVPSSKKIEEDGLHYIHKMSYIENLKHVVRTKCILEIVQGNAKGSTLRTWEAIMYDKKLLTNNLTIANDFYYDGNYISLLNGNYIDVDFIKQHHSYNNPYKNQINPEKLLDFITQRL